MEKLTIYQDSLDLVVEVYQLIRVHSALGRDYALCDQLKRACVSLPANIAEGYGRTKQQFNNHLHIASGSANEMVALLTVLNKVYKIQTQTLIDEYKLLGRQIIAFSRRVSIK